MRKRRTSVDAARYREIRELRRWRDEVVNEPKQGRRRDLIRTHREVVRTYWTDGGWWRWAEVVLRCGHGEDVWQDLEARLAEKIYRHLYRQLRRQR